MVQPARLVFFFLVLVAVVALTAFFSFWPNVANSCPSFTDSTLILNNHAINIGLAESSAQQTQGLSGCSEVPANHGLYFPQDPAQRARFWMKDMLIPIDIIWISGNQVVGIEADVPFHPNLEPSQLPIYMSPGEVTGVLELAAGQAAELSIDTGITIQLVK